MKAAQLISSSDSGMIYFWNSFKGHLMGSFLAAFADQNSQVSQQTKPVLWSVRSVMECGHSPFLCLAVLCATIIDFADGTGPCNEYQQHSCKIFYCASICLSDLCVCQSPTISVLSFASLFTSVNGFIRITPNLSPAHHWRLAGLH